MKHLIPMDDYGVFADLHDTPRANRLIVAQMFEKRHDNVLRDIARITEVQSGLSKEFAAFNFEVSKYSAPPGEIFRA